MALGTSVYLFWALFMNAGTATFLPICKLLTGSSVLFPASILSSLDAVIVALPISVIAMVLVLLLNRKNVSEEPMTV
jgi:hypothetical protein